MNGLAARLYCQKMSYFWNPAKSDHFKLITMNKSILAAALISGFFMVSCGSSDSPEFDSSIGPVDTAKAVQAAVVATDTTPALPANLQTGTGAEQVQPVQVQPQQVTTTTAPAPAATAKGMNPPHGQPGHDCAIAVGAPLNSAPSKPAATTTSATPQVISTTAQPAATPTAAPTVTAPGMNPPHGQPGHDCAIAVGAPLKKTN